MRTARPLRVDDGNAHVPDKLPLLCIDACFFAQMFSFAIWESPLFQLRFWLLILNRSPWLIALHFSFTGVSNMSKTWTRYFLEEGSFRSQSGKTFIDCNYSDVCKHFGYTASLKTTGLPTHQSCPSLTLKPDQYWRTLPQSFLPRKQQHLYHTYHP